MASIELLDNLERAKLISPPKSVLGGTQYLTMMGSHAYGCNKLGSSDFDVYGFCIDTKENTFPHLRGEIPGFGTQIKRFDQWQQHGVDTGNKKYDFAVYNIVRYFQLVMDCNPNMLDSLFTPADCVLHMTSIGRKVRDNRHLFLCKKVFHTMKGYAYAQLHKMQTKNFEHGERAADVEAFGYSLKYSYHLVRLLNECEQILVEGDLDLRRNSEQLKSIRRGEWTLEQVQDYFVDKEKLLESLYHKSELPHKPREQEIKSLLIECLEEYYGGVSDCITNPDASTVALRQIEEIIKGTLKCSNGKNDIAKNAH